MFYLNKLKNYVKANFFTACEKICDTNYERQPVYLSIVAILYNEAPYMKEWIEYHRMLGVERFYLYDNGSTDNVKEILEPYIGEGLVCYHYVEGQAIQNQVYCDAVLKYKDQTRWMAVIDLDEFIYPVEKNNIPEFLKNYEKYCGVAINWQVFDSNGFLEPPKAYGGLVTANYTRTYAQFDCPINRHVKTIFNPKKVSLVVNPHCACYKFNRFAVNENFEKVYDAFTKVHSSSKIKIMHYHCKSKAEYMQKIDKWCADVKRKRVFDERTINIEEWKYDYSMEKFLPELKKRMGIE